MAALTLVWFFHLAWAGAPQLPADMSLCDGLLRYSGTYRMQDLRGQLFNEILGRRPLHTSLAIEFVAGHPALQALNIERIFSGSAGVKEGYSLRVHMRMVLSVLREQEVFYQISEDRRRILEFAVLFHDIGKPLAIDDFVRVHGREPQSHEEFNDLSRRQLEFTLPLLRQVMDVFGITVDEEKIVMAIIADDLMGAVVLRRISPQEAFARLTASAQLAGLSVRDLFEMRMLMYVSDAGSYPGLRYGHERADPPQPPVFVEEQDGRLVPVSPAFGELRELVGATI